jgi:hypothetical protein
MTITNYQLSIIFAFINDRIYYTIDTNSLSLSLPIIIAMIDNVYVRLFLLIFLLIYLIESSGFTYTIGTIDRFEVSIGVGSRISGLLLAGRDFGYILSTILLTLFATKGNRSHWLGTASAISM